MKSWWLLYSWTLAISILSASWLAANNNESKNINPILMNPSADLINPKIEMQIKETKKEVFQFIPKDWYLIPTDEETINKLIKEATEAEEELDEITRSTWNKFYYGCKNFNWKEYYIFAPEMTIPTGFFWDLDKKDYKKLQKAPNCSSTNENQENQENPMT